MDEFGGQYGVEERNFDNTQFRLTPRREMRPGDEITLIARVAATRPGEGFVELQATSDNSAGTIAVGDSILISQ